jgi:hypothetical protein
MSTSIARLPDLFEIEDFDFDTSSLLATDIDGENLFPQATIRFAKKARTFQAIQPALLLASRIILHFPQNFAMFIARRSNISDYVTREDIVPTSSEAIISIIRSVIPDIDVDSDMSKRTEKYAMTYLQPSQSKDLIMLDARLIVAVMSPSFTPLCKTMALFVLAVCICHNIAHVLEFRCIRGGKLNDDQEPFQTPPGITCMEAGSAWEEKTFGGVISPVTFNKNDLATTIGCCSRSASWNFNYMVVSVDFVSRLLTKPFWDNNPVNLTIPFTPKLASFNGIKFDSDKIDSDDESPPPYPTKRRRGFSGDVQVGSPPRFKKEGMRHGERRQLRTLRRTCGGKRVAKGPITFGLDKFPLS